MQFDQYCLLNHLWIDCHLHARLDDIVSQILAHTTQPDDADPNTSLRHIGRAFFSPNTCLATLKPAMPAGIPAYTAT